MSLITGDLWRSALWLNLSFKSLRLLEITDCRQLINQLVESFGYWQARLYVSKFFEPNLRSPRKIQTRVVQTGYLFWHIFRYIVHISYLQHLSGQNHTSSPHLKLDWAAVGKLWLRLTQMVVQLGKYMSPGLELLSGNKFFCSQTGDKFAVEQAANTLSLTLSCRDIISPDSLKRDHPACPVCRFDSKGIFVPQRITERQSDTSMRL